MPILSSFAKFLSENDLGLTGGHQDGPLIPKGYVDHFPRLEATERNPRCRLRLNLPNGNTKNVHFIYYNNRRFGGTRDEYRITPFAPADYRGLGARPGDCVLFQRIADSEYDIEIVPKGSEQAEQLGLPAEAHRGGAAKISNETVGDLNEASARIDAGNFAVPDAWGNAKQRRYQSVFRSVVMKNFNRCCCIPSCIVDDERFLEATHIKPWRDDPNARLDPANGLLLCKMHHIALDAGLISIQKTGADYVVRVASRLGASEFLRTGLFPLRGRRISTPRNFPIGEPYADYHRRRIFLG